MNVYMRMVIPAREYFAKMLLGVIATSRGHETLLGELPKISRGFPPGIYHTNDLGFRKAPQLSKITRAGFVITAQDEEHGLTEESLDFTIATRFHESTLEHVSASFSWGPWDYAGLRERFPSSAAIFHMTGSPRVDLWRRDVAVSRFVDRRAERLRADGRATVLVISNFGPQPTPWWIAAGHSRGAELGLDVDGRLEHMELLAGYQRTAIVFVRAIHALSEHLPDARIVVRPHPTEAWGALAELIGPLPNVLVTREGTTTDWLRAADVMIHSGSTTAFEAVIGGAKAIAYTPDGLNTEFVTNRFALQAQSLAELLEVTRSVIGGDGEAQKVLDARTETAQDLIDGRLFLPQPAMSASLIVDHWEELAQKNGLPAAGLQQAARRARMGRSLRVRPRTGGTSTHTPDGRATDSRGGEVARVSRDETVRFPALRAEEVVADAAAMAEALDLRPIDCRLLSERLILLAPRASGRARSGAPT